MKTFGDLIEPGTVDRLRRPLSSTVGAGWASGAARSELFVHDGHNIGNTGSVTRSVKEMGA